MVSLPVTSARVGLADTGSPVAETAGSFSIAGGDAVGRAVLQAFADDPRLKAAFTASYAQGMNENAEAGRPSRIVAHDALVETILANRESFPPQGFRLETRLDDGTAVATAIPPARTPTVRTSTADAPSVAAPPSAERLAAQSRIISASVPADGATIPLGTVTEDDAG